LMLDWKYRLPGWQAPYFRLIERSTADPYRKVKPLKPEDWVSAFLKLRNKYDAEVSPVQAGWELGLTEFELKRLASKLPTARANALNKGVSIPRDVFESDVYFLMIDALTYGKNYKIPYKGVNR
jgi:hypothetical protein